MYLNGMGLRGSLPDAPESEEIPEVTDLDELQTFVGKKRHKLWIWTAVHHKQAGILAWVIGDHSAETFKLLWFTVKCWHCFFYVTDGWISLPKRLKTLQNCTVINFAPNEHGRNRTCDTQNRNLVLYPLSYMPSSIVIHCRSDSF
jgi:IS1 family transposase